MARGRKRYQKKAAKKKAETERQLWLEAMKRGFVYAPYIPLEVTPTFLGVEPSAVDQLAAVADPEGEGAQRVKEWEERNADWDDLKGAVRRRNYKIKPADPKFFGSCSAANL
jgi:hypothetical protein